MSHYLDRPVLVTGGAGLLGSWLVKDLVARRAEVTCLLRDHDPRSELHASGLDREVRIVRGDVRDRDLLERVLGENEIDTVFHLAAQTLVPVANRNPVSTFDTNVMGTVALLEAARRSALVRSVVVASSDKAYGAAALPYTEDTPLRARFPYDTSKACADLIAQSYASSFGLPVAITRCGNLFGGGDLNWNRIVPGTIRSVLRDERPVLRSDGTDVRDYLYVEDAVDAYLLLGERLRKDPALAGEAFNVSYEEPMTTLALVRAILRATGSSLEPVIGSRATHEIPAQHLSADKARARLGFSPRHALEGGLDRTVSWYRAHFHALTPPVRPALAS